MYMDEKRREELLNSDDAFAVDMPSFYTEKNVFYLPEHARWSLIKDNAKKEKITEYKYFVLDEDGKKTTEE